MLNLHRFELLDLFVKTLQIALEGLPGSDAATVVDTGDVLNAPEKAWIGFQNYVVATDRCQQLATPQLVPCTTFQPAGPALNDVGDAAS
jgi:hypothetical protein